MVKAYSDDLRERVVQAVAAGASVRAVASRFGVAVSSVVKWHQLYRRTQSVRPLGTGGRRGSVLESERDFILGRIASQSHVTVRGLRDELADRGVHVSHHAVWLFLRREGLTHKKRTAGARARKS